jgi:HEAT repeat protein
MDRREWDNAIEQFQVVIDQKAARADGALYWKAYAQNKSGKRQEALATLAELQKAHPGSRWLNDAKALEVEVRQSAGQPVSPEAESDEELKLLAVNSLMHSEPERAVPLLENLLSRSTSPKLKERALFVLAQNQLPKAREIVTKYAKGGSNPDLQVQAIEYLGMRDSPENRQALSEIYSATNDIPARRAVLRAYMMLRDKDRLMAAAKGESNPELRLEAIRGLGASRAGDQLLELIRSEKDAKVRGEAIMMFATVRDEKFRDALPSLYASEQDPKVKRNILHGMLVQKNAKGLIDVARKETNLEMKREAVQLLASMRSKEANDYLVELLK